MARPPSEDEIVLFAENLLLVEEFEALTVAGFRIGRPGEQVMLALGFTGRINNTDRRETFHVGFHLKDGLALVDTIVDSVTRAFPNPPAEPGASFRRPQ